MLDLLQALTGGLLSQPIRLTLIGWPGREAALADDLAMLGLDPAQPLDASQIAQIAHLPSLRWAEPAIELRLFNDKARAIIGVPAVWENHGLYGKGQVVGVADSGLDTGDPATLSFSPRRRASFAAPCSPASHRVSTNQRSCGAA